MKFKITGIAKGVVNPVSTEIEAIDSEHARFKASELGLEVVRIEPLILPEMLKLESQRRLRAALSKFVAGFVVLSLLAAAMFAAFDVWPFRRSTTDYAVGQAFSVGDFPVRVTGVSRGELRTPFSERYASVITEGVIVKIEVVNTSAVRKHFLFNWGREPGLPVEYRAALRDEHGNEYDQQDMTNLGMAFFPHLWSRDVWPGVKLNGVLLFEQPVPAAKNLRLVLPNSALGSEGVSCVAFPVPPKSTQPEMFRN